MAENINTVKETDLDTILDGHTVSRPHADHLLSDKIVFPKSKYFGQKGESYMLYNGGDEQWYFRPNGSDEFIRVKWYALDSNVSEGSYGKCRYRGINASILDKVGELFYTSKQWYFHLADDEGVEKYKLNSPDSVEIF